MLIQRIFALAIAGKSGSRNLDLLGDGSKHWLGNVLYFHEGATGKLQEGKLDREAWAIRSSSPAIDEFPLFLSKRVIACNVSFREVSGNLCEGVTLFRVEVRWNLVISRHGRGLSSFALFVSYCPLARQ